MTEMELPHGLSLDKRHVRDAFERAARTYEPAAVLQREIADRMLDRLDLIRRVPDCILDAGCGTGHCSRSLRRRYPRARIIALDIARAMVQQARERSRRLAQAPLLARLARSMGYGPYENLQFACGDIEALPVADASVDMIVSNLALQWCAPERVFADFARVLRPGGILMFTSFGPDTLRELRRAWEIVDDRPHVHAFIDMHDLGDAVVRAGFADPVMDMQHFTLTYPDVTEVMRDLKRLGAHNAALGRARGLTGKTRFGRFRAAYEAQAVNGRVPATYEAVYGHAWAPETGIAGRTADGSIAIPLARLRRMR